MTNAIKLRNDSQNALVKIRGILTPVAKDVYAQGNKAGKQFYKAYPILVKNVRDNAYKTINQGSSKLKSACSQVSHTVQDWSEHHYVERSLLKVGFIYAAYRLITANARVAQTTAKVKARIVRRPVESAAIALGAGYIIGKLLRR